MLLVKWMLQHCGDKLSSATPIYMHDSARLNISVKVFFGFVFLFVFKQKSKQITVKSNQHTLTPSSVKGKLWEAWEKLWVINMQSQSSRAVTWIITSSQNKLHGQSSRKCDINHHKLPNSFFFFFFQMTNTIIQYIRLRHHLKFNIQLTSAGQGA